MNNFAHYRIKVYIKHAVEFKTTRYNNSKHSLFNWTVCSFNLYFFFYFFIPITIYSPYRLNFTMKPKEHQGPRYFTTTCYCPTSSGSDLIMTVNPQMMTPKFISAAQLTSLCFMDCNQIHITSIKQRPLERLIFLVWQGLHQQNR